MYLELSEGEAHILILKGMGLEADATLKKRAGLHVLSSPHKIVIQSPGEAASIFAPEQTTLFPVPLGKTCGPNCTCVPAEKTKEEIPDDCFVVDGVPDLSGQEFEEDLDGT